MSDPWLNLSLLSLKVWGGGQIRDWFFTEVPADRRGINTGPNTDNQSVSEIYDPAVASIEAHAVLGRCQRSKFDDCLIMFDKQVFHS
jgi:hypothetical protein